MARAKSIVATPVVSAAIGGLVVGLMGYLAIAAGWIGKTHEYGFSGAQAPLLRPASDKGRGTTVNAIYRKDAPGVAFVEAESAPRSASPFDLFPQQPGPATGSGFVIDKEGHVLTNAHVVAGADRIRVALGDNKSFVDAKKVGEDPSTDIALLKVEVEATKLHPLELGESSKVRVGDPVVAIGNPFGLDRTVTSGIVSALQRQIDAPNHFTIDNVIQTDAPINPGNSGGPLLNAEGQVIGINSQIETAGGGGSVGIGFAIPVDTARKVVDQLLKDGQVHHAFLGITGTGIDPSIAKALNLPATEGVLVQDVFRGGPADRAGIRGGDTQATLDGQDLLLGGDIVTGIDGRKLTDMQQVVRAVDAKEPGDKIDLQILRDGEHRTVTVTLGERPDRIQDSVIGQ